MKVLLVHNYHRTGSASGDDQVFNAEAKLLTDAGIEVVRYSVCNDEFDDAGITGKICSAIGMFWSISSYRNILNIIRAEKPDLVHVHTLFPLLSPSVLAAAKKANLKVVATLHDTRLVCPVATSLRDGKICNSCADGCFFRMVKHKCFKGSALQSAVVAAIFSYHRMKKTFYKLIDKYICLNDEQVGLLEAVGYDKSKIVKKYNFVEDASLNERANSKPPFLPMRYVVYYGRIGEEKGIRFLMKAWESMEDIPLVVMGDGPLGAEFDEWAKSRSNVYYMGYTPHDRCMQIVSYCSFVVFPTIWYEGCSMVFIESESLGKPVIATDLGFCSEAIENDYNGLKFKLNDIGSFTCMVRELWNNSDEVKKMSQAARGDYLKKYTPAKNICQLLDIYRSVLGAN